MIALPNGALAEVIEPGVTGFLVRDEHEMAEAIGQVGSLVREACRASARQRFSPARMVERYLDLYRELTLLRRRVA